MNGVTHFEALECGENWELHCLSCLNWGEFTLWGKAFLYACLIAITEATCHKIRFSEENKQVLQNECFEMNYQQEQNTIEIEGRLFIITEAKITLKQSITTHKHPRLPRATKTAYT